MSRSQSKRSHTARYNSSEQTQAASTASLVPGGNHIMQLQQMLGNRQLTSMLQQNNPIQKVAKEETESTGASASPASSKMPAQLQQGLENLSGMNLSDVNVHYQSDKPAQLGAHAYAQGNDIHVAPGQEKHLPHEGWHVVQQRQGRVKADTQVNDVAVNADPVLEQEATNKGEQAMQLAKDDRAPLPIASGASSSSAVVQQMKVVQMVKQAVPAPPDQTIKSMRNLLTLYQAQAQEYVGHPLAIANSWNPAAVETSLAEALVTLNEIVTDLTWNDDSLYDAKAITQHYGNNVKLEEFKNKANNAVKEVKEFFTEWKDWNFTTPEDIGDLSKQRLGSQLGDTDQANIVFGMFENTDKIYKVKGSPYPKLVDKDEDRRYRALLKRELDIDELKVSVSRLDMTGAVTVPEDSSLQSPSSGAKSIKEILTSSGDMYMSRVMSTIEAQSVRDNGGKFIPKLAAAKWITIGTTANIHSSGDSRHNQSVQWKIDGNFRKVLMMEGMNYYNENHDRSVNYKEPYWVWKDAEVGNIAISPVLNVIFNNMIKEVTINGTTI